MITVRPMRKDETAYVFEWNEESEDFLRQWSNFVYPLTRKQITDRIDSPEYLVYIVEENGTPAGTVQMYRVDETSGCARVGCYLIDRVRRGRGIGAKALTALAEHAHHELNLRQLTLGVIEGNDAAAQCYEKCGFTRTDEYRHASGQIVYNMALCLDGDR